MITRRCAHCHRPFEVRPGSLIRVCKRDDCREVRREVRLRRNTATEAERKRMEDIRTDDKIRPIWEEVEEVLRLISGGMDRPGREDLARAVKAVCDARGAWPTRDALLEVSAVALRWAGSLPKKGERLNANNVALEADIDLAA